MSYLMPLSIPIPEKFMLFGMVIEVIWDDNLLATTGSYGEADLNNSRIILQRPSKTIVISEQHLVSIFLHEMCHMILYHLGYENYEDEVYVSGISGLLHQAFTTFTYKDQE